MKEAAPHDFNDRAQKNSANFFSIEFFWNPSGHGRTAYLKYSRIIYNWLHNFSGGRQWLITSTKIRNCNCNGYGDFMSSPGIPPNAEYCFASTVSKEKFRNLGTTQFWKKRLSEWKGHSRSNSRNSGAFSEQFSEWRSRPNLCENGFNPILGATLGATLGIGWTPISPNSRSVLFKIGVVPARNFQTHWVLHQTHWGWETQWVLFGTQIGGWEELTELSAWSSVRAKKLIEFGARSRALWNRIRAMSEKWLDPR